MLGKINNEQHKLTINPRMHGGWGDKQHLGYEEEKTDPQQLANQQKEKKIKAYNNEEGTYQWVLDLMTILNHKLAWELSTSFVPISKLTEPEKIAQKIAGACNYVDYNPETNPVAVASSNWKNAQQFHFNTNGTPNGYPDQNEYKDQVNPGGSKGDSRIILAVKYLKKAVKGYRKNRK